MTKNMLSYLPYVFNIMRIPIIIVGAFMAIRILNAIIERFEKKISDHIKAKEKTMLPIEIEKRVQTVGNLLKKVIFVSIWLVAAMMVIKELGFDVKPILAGAGIIGLAVSFGAQNLVRDIISGLFIIIENQIRVGDVAIINGTGGLVEAINLRTTVLRGLDGTVHIFPNGTINTLSNMTHEYSYYVFDIGVAYKEDVDRVMEILKEIGNEIMQDEYYRSLIIEPLEIWGVDKFADSAVIIKARIKTLPIKQWEVGREINRRIKKRFDEEGIEIPFPHHSLYAGEASKPFRIKIEGLDREELKNLIREVLEEKSFAK
ncbi:MAG: mechanosensitive ion channel family protein [Deltaproteobacteria bacterium]|nr:mechanosensitive ion channel family protein [Deltaproteobacteria bacterium]